MGIFQRCHEWEFFGLLQCMIKEFRRMPFIWDYQRPLTKKRNRVPITLRRKGWVHWNIIQECWHTGNSQILLPLLLEIGPIWIISKNNCNIFNLFVTIATFPPWYSAILYPHPTLLPSALTSSPYTYTFTDSNHTSICHALFLVANYNPYHKIALLNLKDEN